MHLVEDSLGQLSCLLGMYVVVRVGFSNHVQSNDPIVGVLLHPDSVASFLPIFSRAASRGRLTFTKDERYVYPRSF